MTEGQPVPPQDPEAETALLALIPPGSSRPDPDLIRMRAPAIEHADIEALDPDGRFSLTQQVVATSDGGEIRLIVARPTTVAPRGCAYNIHGGGMVSGSPLDGMAELLDHAAALGLVVVSVDYRLAPEHPHPTPLEDCYAGLVWVESMLDTWNVPPHALIITGGSAGGGLAACCAIVARDRSGPALAGQLLLAPMLDSRNDSYSVHQLAGTGTWDRAYNTFGWAALLGRRSGSEELDPPASAALVPDLSSLPPTYLDVGSTDTFRDETVAYADRLWKAGCSAELHVWPGGFHGFEVFAPRSALAVAARAARLDWLRRRLRTA
ncbi:alpha/beta hydrolase fold domain-containing protein [Microbacteriaceae bacterium VKM Ac-2855]|nr:alpha/beta hydrolase fold domain-containing protein [Microbacteriaceae bacterium VKM Ac-2855]